MKQIKIIFTIFILFFTISSVISVVDAASKRWYNKEASGQSRNSWCPVSGRGSCNKCSNDSCAPGKSVRSAWTWYSHTYNCYNFDTTNPVIAGIVAKDASWTTYTSWIWKDTASIKLDFKVTDSWAWLHSSYTYITVNWSRVNFNTWNKFNYTKSITFSTPWEYYIEVFASDATPYTWDSFGGNWHTDYKTFKVRIDRRSPSFSQNISETTSNVLRWFKGLPKINYAINDSYDWAPIVKKVFTCDIIPSNSFTSSPVKWWFVYWFCNPNTWANCALDSSFTPNKNDCNYTCNSWYTNDNDECILTTIDLDCDDSTTVDFPTDVYLYDEYENLIVNSSWATDKVAWNAPSWILIDWSFIASYDIPTHDYLPELNSCNYTCAKWLHKEIYQDWKCVNNTSITCCVKGKLEYLADVWAAVDCDLVENADNPRCVYNELCGWFVKDVFWKWNLSDDKWEFDDSDWNLSDDSGWACGYVPRPNSTWKVCKASYYLTWAEVSNDLACIDVPVWEWSNGIKSWDQWDKKYNCTNKPSNSHYVSNGINNGQNKNYDELWNKIIDCDYQCNSWYVNNDNWSNSYTKTYINNLDKGNEFWDYDYVAHNWNCIKERDWQCGYWDWEYLDDKPNTDELKCWVWKYKYDRYKSWKYEWECQWTTRRARDVDCSAAKIYVSCGSSNWDDVWTIPTTNLCNNGTFGTIEWNDQNWTDWTFNWKCVWINSSHYSYCSANKLNYCKADWANNCTVQ